MAHPAIAPGRTAVIIGGASGIGLATARSLAAVGMKVALADAVADALPGAEAQVREAGAAEVATFRVDVARLDEVEGLKTAVLDRFGDVAFLMNNAGIGGGGGAWDSYEGWRRVTEVNLWGVVHGVQSFTQAMLDQGRPGAIVNTGSKQGITNPPGDVAYNVSKAGVKTLTEALAHQLRTVEGGQVSAHLLVPGFTYTGLTARRLPEKPPAAWTPEQVVDELLHGMDRGDFYIICPDNEVTRAMDEKRVRWGAEDLILNRPALSRWHPDYKDEFERFMRA